MRHSRTILLLCAAVCVLLGSSAVSFAVQAPASEDERALWNLEDAYWRYVQANDLATYRTLWHKDFLGWPAANAAPVHKDHITDWITTQTDKGLAFKNVELKPAATQVTGDGAVTCYWITYKLVDKEGNGATHTLRVLHSWLRENKEWRIISGMAMPEAAGPPK